MANPRRVLTLRIIAPGTLAMTVFATFFCPALAEAEGPDFYRVTGVTANTVGVSSLDGACGIEENRSRKLLDFATLHRGYLSA